MSFVGNKNRERLTKMHVSFQWKCKIPISTKETHIYFLLYHLIWRIVEQQNLFCEILEEIILTLVRQYDDHMNR